uniref:acyltransferase-like protein At1g54570, chloroplastic n=1 Tax=Erigeron canadensis TaxID=72917 RepID=UPI001CB8B839|nr:acyltransferase-like protein At1g54570, chloroplastic [Erigeron canadensis]
MALTLSNSIVPLSPFITRNESHRVHSRVLVRVVGSEDSGTVSWESVRNNGASSVNRKGIGVASYEDIGRQDGGNVLEVLEPLWDDGFGTYTVKDCIDLITRDLIKSDGGSPTWFCPVRIGKPLKDSPVLLYLPGIDGTGAGLTAHEKSLGKVFHIQCLHIPVFDRTPLEGLIQIVEETVMIEHTLSPKKPIYLLGDSFGGALALAVAARNPTIDLMLVLVNPATSYENSSLHTLSYLVRAFPEEYHRMLSYAMNPLLGDYMKTEMVTIDGGHYLQSGWQLPRNHSKDLPLLFEVARILPKDTLNWRLKLVESAAAYVNSRLHAVTAQVLVLASGKDNVMPSKKEGQRLSRLLKHCHIRVFEDNGHTLLSENGVNVLSAIKATQMYRRFSKHDILKDFLPLSISDFKHSPVETWWYRLLLGSAVFSTMEDGKVVRGLAGIPDEGPVIIVGNHMLLAFDVIPVVSEYLRQKKIVLHGLAHPELFHFGPEHEYFMVAFTDILKVGGSIPVSGKNLFRLLARKSHVLLYPGGFRESLHRKGEAGKLFWPDKPEFVKMAVKFGATIVPFGGVGIDEISEIIIDYNDMQRYPFLGQKVKEFNQGRTNLRAEMAGEVSKQPIHIPITFPKIPGRLYFMFGKPIRMKGKENMSNDEEYLQELYSQLRCDVECIISYLLKKREEDPYRGIVKRILSQSYNTSIDQIPSFEP